MSGYTSNISFGGLASGLDSRALIEQLVAINRRPITLIEQRISQYKQKKSIIDKLETMLEDLQDKVEVLKDTDAFLSYSASMNKEDIISVSAGSGAAPGTYLINVLALAKAESEASQGYADANTTTVGTGTLSITVGGEQTDITIEPGGDTLAEVVSAINNSDAEVTASILNDGGANPYRLVITANESGTENAISIDASGLSGGDQGLVFSEVQTAADASIEVNGISLTRSSNEIDDAIENVTLNLLDTGTDVELTINPDRDAIKEKIKDFVNAYNSVMSYIDGQFKYNSGLLTGSSLLGDFSLRIVQRRFQSITNGPETYLDIDPDAVFSNLSAIGITSNSDGTLKINDDILGDAIADNVTALSQLFTDEEDGMAVRFYDSIEDITRSFDGLLANRQKGIDRTIRNLNDQIDRLEDRLSRYEQRLVTKFAALEGLMARLQSTSNFFMGNQTGN